MVLDRRLTDAIKVLVIDNVDQTSGELFGFVKAIVPAIVRISCVARDDKR